MFGSFYSRPHLAEEVACIGGALYALRVCLADVALYAHFVVGVVRLDQTLRPDYRTLIKIWLNSTSHVYLNFFLSTNLKQMSEHMDIFSTDLKQKSEHMNIFSTDLKQKSVHINTFSTDPKQKKL